MTSVCAMFVEALRRIAEICGDCRYGVLQRTAVCLDRCWGMNTKYITLKTPAPSRCLIYRHRYVDFMTPHFLGPPCVRPDRTRPAENKHTVMIRGIGDASSSDYSQTLNG